MDTDKLFFWIEALTYLRPDQINMLTHLAEQGEQIEEMIEEAVRQKLERDGLLDLYRKEHEPPEDWPFGEQYKDDEEEGDEPDFWCRYELGLGHSALTEPDTFQLKLQRSAWFPRYRRSAVRNDSPS